KRIFQSVSPYSWKRSEICRGTENNFLSRNRSNPPWTKSPRFWSQCSQDFSPYPKSGGQLIDLAGFAMSDLPVTNPIPPTAPRCSEAASCISLEIQEVPNS